MAGSVMRSGLTATLGQRKSPESDATAGSTSYKKGVGGQGGIRTHGELPPTTVFKTVALNHSATCPLSRL
jgi:hypothetical protein